MGYRPPHTPYLVLSTQYAVRGSRRYPRHPLACCRLAIICLLLATLTVSQLSAQVFERSITLPPAEIELLDAASAAQLENARRFLAERQWEEAVKAIRRVQEAEPTRLVKVDLSRPIAGFERYVPAA